jgi:hypothetical protein
MDKKERARFKALIRKMNLGKYARRVADRAVVDFITRPEVMKEIVEKCAIPCLLEGVLKQAPPKKKSKPKVIRRKAKPKKKPRKKKPTKKKAKTKTTGKKCKVPGCNRPHQAKGYCARHYQSKVAWPKRTKKRKKKG